MGWHDTDTFNGEPHQRVQCRSLPHRAARFPNQPHWIGVIQDHYDVTWANAAGVTLTNTVRQTIQEDSLIDNGDGTWTYTFTINGMPEFLRNVNGHVNKDAGRLTQQIVFYFGNLSTQADDEVLSQTILKITGPHATAESGFEIFCQNVHKVLG